MLRRPPRSTLFPTRRSSDLKFARRTAAEYGQVPQVQVHVIRHHQIEKAVSIVVCKRRPRGPSAIPHSRLRRSEEHTSELQSRRDLVCRLLLEKKKKPSTHLF